MTPLRQAWVYDDRVLGDFIQAGRHVFPEPVDPAAAAELLAEIRAQRAFDETLFPSQAAFDADPSPRRNLLDRFEDRLGFVERAPQLVEALSGLLGDDYRIADRRIVCSLPERAVPAWVKARLDGGPLGDLDAFVQPQFRDATYVCGADFRQDLAEGPDGGPDGGPDVITLWVGLQPVGREDAPVHLLDGSHALGATAFPHDLRTDGPGHWIYGDRRGQERLLRQEALTGPAGHAVLWHACALHGAPPAADQAQFALRYRLARGGVASVGVDVVNASLRGPLRLTETAGARPAQDRIAKAG
ncbi:MAG: phytanoyl-CoA dioxygenase family protein [Caulobacteraceae bacterium]|nr:phytanoyl-CoA dioxygenase family protein [Caulobacteraceae bacterium]